jgi:hypothetical protein
MSDDFIPAKTSEVDLMWLRVMGRAYRIRPATPAESEAFPRNWPDYPHLKTVIRARDEASATFAFNGDDPDMWRNTDEMIAIWFDRDLDRLGRRH